MTDHEGNWKIYLARGIQEGLEQLTIPEATQRVIVNFFNFFQAGVPRARYIVMRSVIICFIISLYAYCE